MQSLETQNKYADCLWMQLEAIPTAAATMSQGFDLYLTLNFNEHWEPILGGRVKLGLQGGTLKLALENSSISRESRQLVGRVDLVSTDESATQRVSHSATFLTEDEPEQRDKQYVVSCQVTRAGDENQPIWSFEVEQKASVLKGLLKRAKLGQIMADSCHIDATFEVTKQDLYITDAEGLWRHDITPNQHAILSRILVNDLLENKFAPYLSRAEFSYHYPQVKQNASPTSRSDSDKLLAEQFDKIITAETQDFSELVNLAGLNLRSDFAGANLRGTLLKGIDFSGANLHRANLRGVDFSDADLSEANLSAAKLGGADLSGAFLSNADLTNADLHRASLALANLSGANLSGANLREATLTNANFSGANLTNARFGKNAGITEEMKLNFKQRGALIEDA